MTPQRAAAVFLLAAALPACGAPGYAASEPMPDAVRVMAEGTGGGGAGEARQVIRRASLTVEVGEIDAAVAQAEAAVAAVDGLVASARSYGHDRAHLALRVPAPALDGVLAELRGLGEVEDESVSAVDVTGTVVDLEARLTNLVAVRDRLRGYLDRTADLEDIIAIERELTRVQTEIDTLTGQLERIRGQVALSDVSLTLTRRRVLGPLGLLVTGAAWVVSKLFVIR